MAELLMVAAVMGLLWMMVVSGAIFYGIWRMVQNERQREVSRAIEWERFDSQDKREFEKSLAAGRGWSGME